MDAQSAAHEVLGKLLSDLIQRADEDRRAAFVISMATLSLLVDIGAVDTEQAVARIARVRDALPDALRSERLDGHLKLAEDWLRLREAAMEQRERESAVRPVWKPEVIPGGRQGSDT